MLPGGGAGYTKWRAGFPSKNMGKLMVLSVHQDLIYTGMVNVNEGKTALALCET